MDAKIVTLSLVVLASGAAVTATAQSAMHHGMKRTHGAKMVAYDPKDKRLYSRGYARAHGMRDQDGDPLKIVALSSVPKEAKESRQMHGAKL